MTDTTHHRAGQGSAREQLAHVWDAESATTQRVLDAYPADQGELRPHERSKTARELAWMFTMEMSAVSHALRGAFDMTQFPPTPASFDDVRAAFAPAREELLETLRTAGDEQLSGATRFVVGPGQMGDVPNAQLAWFMLHDHIHHRGQFSVYLRMAGGKVPSIYGPTADEPWR